VVNAVYGHPASSSSDQADRRAPWRASCFPSVFERLGRPAQCALAGLTTARCRCSARVG
jgi:hypothetical protein